MNITEKLITSEWWAGERSAMPFLIVTEAKFMWKGAEFGLAFINIESEPILSQTAVTFQF